MKTSKDVRRVIRLDAETDRLLTVLARPHEDNLSLTMRELIRKAGREYLNKIEVRPSRAA